MEIWWVFLKNIWIYKSYIYIYILFRTNAYEISEADSVERGTKIVMHLKPDCREYASEDVVRKVINKYSNFVNSPIKLNGSEINTIQVRLLLILKQISISCLNHFSHYGYMIQNLLPMSNMMSSTNL